MKILYVEDDQLQIMLIDRILSAYGHDLVSASQPYDALHQAVQERPHLILVDIHLPQMSGFELATQLRQQQGEAVAIVALTADSGYHPTDYADCGFDDFLVKPFSRQAFINLVNRFEGDRASF